MFRALKQLLNRALLPPHGFGPVKEMWIVNHVCSMFRIWGFAIATKEVMKFRPMEVSTRYGLEHCRSSNHMAEKKIGATWYWFRYEFPVQRGSIHCHGVAKLNFDPNLCDK